MMLRSTTALLVGLFARPALAQAPATAPAPTVPAPAHVPPPAPATTPAPTETGEVVATPPPPPPGGETLPAATPTPAPYAGSTPAPTPYAGPPLTAPPGSGRAPTPPPTPGGQPASTAGFDFGNAAMSPLPPPPAPADPSTIRHQPWRGHWWIGIRGGITGPIGGAIPARPTLLTLGGGMDVGYRLGNVLGLGMGLSGQIHTQIIGRVPTSDGGFGDAKLTGRMLYWDALFARVHLPLKRRFQPYVEVGGGLARLIRAEHGLADNNGIPSRSYGAQMRGALGLEGWVSRSVTIGVAAVYRLNAFKDSGRWVVGHALQGIVELGLHW